MRILRMTEANKKQVLKDVAAQLDGLVVIPDTLSVKLSTSKKPKSSPKIIFTDEAADKIWELVDACDKEIAWHGLVKKEKNTYTIYDILVFPQEVTASTATAKEEEYVMWMNELDDETFNHMRFHGHSHVNMGVTPSGVDTDYQETLANTVQDFYIFGIFNKKRSYNLYLYDMKQNVLFETKDLKTTLNDHTSTWADEQIEKFVTVYKTYPKYYGAHVGGNYYYEKQRHAALDKATEIKGQSHLTTHDVLDKAEEEAQEFEDRDVPQDSAYERYMRELHPELYFGGDL